MKTLAILLFAATLVSPAFAEPRSANTHYKPAVQTATKGQSHKASALNKNDADHDFDNDTVRPEYVR